MSSYFSEYIHVDVAERHHWGSEAIEAVTSTSIKVESFYTRLLK